MRLKDKKYESGILVGVSQKDHEILGSSRGVVHGSVTAWSPQEATWLGKCNLRRPEIEGVSPGEDSGMNVSE